MSFSAGILLSIIISLMTPRLSYFNCFTFLFLTFNGFQVICTKSLSDDREPKNGWTWRWERRSDRKCISSAKLLMMLTRIWWAVMLSSVFFQASAPLHFPSNDMGRTNATRIPTAIGSSPKAPVLFSRYNCKCRRRRSSISKMLLECLRLTFPSGFCSSAQARIRQTFK